MSQDEIIQSRWWSTEDETAYFTISTANADFQDTKFNLKICLNMRLSDIDYSD